MNSFLPRPSRSRAPWIAALALAAGLGATLVAPAAQAHVSIGLSVPLGYGYAAPPVYYSPPPPAYYTTPPQGYSTTTTDEYGNTVVITQPTPGVVVRQPVPVIAPYTGYGPYPGYGYGVVNPAYIGGYIMGRGR